MRLIGLLFLFWLTVLPAAFGQKSIKVDTVSAFRAINEGLRLEKAAKYDSAIKAYQQSADGYKAYAVSLPEKKKYAAPQKRAWEQHFEAQAGIGWCLMGIGQHDSAIKSLFQAKTVCSQVLGDSNLAMASIASSTGEAFKVQGQYAQALEFFQQAFAIRKQIFGEHPNLVASYTNIGNVYYFQGQYAQAFEYYQHGLKIQKQFLSETHPNLASSYNSIGNIYVEQGLYVEALEFFKQALEIWKKAFGEQSQQVAGSYSNIGRIYIIQGHYNKGLEYFHQALAIRKQIFGKQHPFVASSYNSIGGAYLQTGQYALALEYYQQALAIRKQVLGEQHPDVAINYANIGILYFYQGRAAEALAYSNQSLAILKHVLGDQHPEVAKSFINIANVYIYQGQYHQALENQLQALAILKQAFIESHPNLAIHYKSVGHTYVKLGQFQEAMKNFEQALEIFILTFGEQHPEIALTYHNIGLLYNIKGQFAAAISEYRKSLNAFLPHYRANGFHSLRSNSPEVLKFPLTHLCQSLAFRKNAGDDNLALATVRFADCFIDSLRRAYTYENDKLQLGADANQLYQVAIDVAQWNKQDEECFYYSEKNKAAVLAQSLNEATALKLGGIPDSLLNKDKELRTQVAYYTKASIDEELNCPKCDSTKLLNLKSGLFTYQQQHTALKTKLESEFLQYFALKYKAAKISVKEVQQGFLTDNPNTAIIEYLLGDTVLYAFCITKDKYSIHRQKLDSTRFKKTNALQLEVKKLGRALADINLYLDPTTTVSQPAGVLYEYLIKPFEQQIKGKDLIIIPDAELNKIPFELLMEPNPNMKAVSKWQDLPYLIKQHNISYHYSAHLLLEEWQKGKKQPVKSSGFVAFAPVFDDTSTGKIVSNENVVEKSYLAYISREDTLSRAFTNDGRLITPLPGTEREVKAIYELFNQRNQPAKYYLNDQANESMVKSINLKPYKYLHFATHGLTDEDRPTNSCLILAQNQLPTPNPSPSGEGPGVGDNLLTSSEMYGLEIDAELVVLSACQTGKGTLKAGEGIIGLTRGLLYAGARNLLVSQWNVNDASTAELMTKFYSKILAGQSNRQALREAKLELLNSKFACPHYWSAFVLVGR
jgi:CHAT domain-containing protein/Tfp pilus assembly protein PilF